MKQILVVNRECVEVAKALVDDEDYDRASKVTWHLTQKRNVVAYVYTKLNNGKHSWRGGRKMDQLALQRLVMNAQEGMVVKFRSNDTLDCRKENLVVVSRSYIGAGRPSWSKNPYKGISFNRASSKWEACISHEKIRYALGTYETPEAAARAYDRANHELYGDLGFLNFPDEDPRSHPIIVTVRSRQHVLDRNEAEATV